MFESEAEICGRDTPGGFVYLLALSDCTAFKVGFTCNPLQRIHDFSRRYFERFDLHQSQLLAIDHAAVARAIEARLKYQLAPFRIEAPLWLPEAAGGHTEWFSAVHFIDALEVLREYAGEADATRCLSAFELVRSELVSRCREFEHWAWQRACELAHVPNSTRAAQALCDWLDAYRYCEIPLFADDPAVACSVLEAARRGHPDLQAPIVKRRGHTPGRTSLRPTRK